MDNTQLPGSGQPVGKNDTGNVFDEGAIHAAKPTVVAHLESSAHDVHEEHVNVDPATLLHPEGCLAGSPLTAPISPKKPSWKVYAGAFASLFIVVTVVYLSVTGGFRQLMGDVTVPGDDDDNDGLTNEAEFAMGTNPLAVDSDGDGLSDGDELTTDPLNWDSDNDGISDSQDVAPLDAGVPGTDDVDEDDMPDALEILAGYDPNEADSDAPSSPDYVNDGAEDFDGDGLSNSTEISTYLTNFQAADTDGDGLGDNEELSVYSTSPVLWDSDSDNISDSVEVDGNNPTNPDDDDSDNDLLADGQEDVNYNGVLDMGETNPNNPDTDGDDLSDGNEVTYGTDPLDPDTDDDGLSDGEEDENGTDPLDPCDPTACPLPADDDSDNDGVDDEDDLNDSNPCVPNTSNSVCQASDQDEDELTYAQETAMGTDPDDSDTDNDTEFDNEDVSPLDPCNPYPDSSVCLPDLIISEININPSLEDFSFVVENTGGGQVVPDGGGNYPLFQISVNGNVIEGGWEPSPVVYDYDYYNPGGSNTMTYTDLVSPLEVGNTVGVCADGDGNYSPEIDENNNCLSVSTDMDGDGLLNWVETDTGVFVGATDTGTNPNNPDSDGDGTQDGDEVNATFGYATDPNNADTDNDGFSDGNEVHILFTNPLEFCDPNYSDVACAPSGVDLVISDIGFDLDNEELEFTVSNQGNQALSFNPSDQEVYVSISQNGSPLVPEFDLTEDVPYSFAAPNGGSEDFTYTVSTYEDGDVFEVCADSTFEYSELDENNNCSSFTLLTPDIEVLIQSYDSTTQELTFDVSNTGAGDVTFDISGGAEIYASVELGLANYINKEFVIAPPDDFFPSGGNATYVYTVTEVVNDGDIFQVCADFENVVAEADENNNCSSFTAVVDTDGDGVPDVSDNCPSDANPAQEDVDVDNVGSGCDGDDVNPCEPDESSVACLAVPPDPVLPPDLTVDVTGYSTDTDVLAFNINNIGAGDAVPQSGETINVSIVLESDTLEEKLPVTSDPVLSGGSLPSSYNVTTATVQDSDVFQVCVFTDILTVVDADSTNDCDTLTVTFPVEPPASDVNPDGDGLPNDADNCPVNYNPLQEDFDGDGLGNACDTDDDDDGLSDTEEFVIGTDPLDEDTDGDGLKDGDDIAPLDPCVPNACGPSSGGLPDVITSTEGYDPVDNEVMFTVSNVGTAAVVVSGNVFASIELNSVLMEDEFVIAPPTDFFPVGGKAEYTYAFPDAVTIVNGDHINVCSDSGDIIAESDENNCSEYVVSGLPVPADDDDDVPPPPALVDVDGDGVADASDNCPAVANASQVDVDGDGIGDACDVVVVVPPPPAPDADGDGVADAIDNCPAVSNTSQADMDSNGIGNACDDIDHDTVMDASDNCPTVPNASQADTDSDGTGDACESVPVTPPSGGGGGGGGGSPSSGGGGGGGGYTLPFSVLHTPSTFVDVGLESSVETPEEEPVSCYANRSGVLSDVASHWSREGANKAYQLSIIDGYAGKKFNPDKHMNRAEFMKVVLKALCVETPEAVSNKPFPDVEKAIWFAKYVHAAKLKGFISGYKDGTFGPGNDLTRAEALKVLLLAAGEEVGNYKSSLFSDTKGHWAVKYIETARRKGYVRGYSDGSVRPDAPITRAEVITLINRMVIEQDAWKPYVK